MSFPQLWVVPAYIILILMMNKYPKVCGLVLLMSLVCKIWHEVLYVLSDLGFAYFWMPWKSLDAVGKSPLRSSRLAVTTPSHAQNLKMMTTVEGSRTSCSLCFGNRSPYSLLLSCVLLFVCAFAVTNSFWWSPGPFCGRCWRCPRWAADSCPPWEDKRAGGKLDFWILKLPSMSLAGFSFWEVQCERSDSKTFIISVKTVMRITTTTVHG